MSRKFEVNEFDACWVEQCCFRSLSKKILTSMKCWFWSEDWNWWENHWIEDWGWWMLDRHDNSRDIQRFRRSVHWIDLLAVNHWFHSWLLWMNTIRMRRPRKWSLYSTLCLWSFALNIIIRSIDRLTFSSFHCEICNKKNDLIKWWKRLAHVCRSMANARSTHRTARKKNNRLTWVISKKVHDDLLSFSITKDYHSDTAII